MSRDIFSNRSPRKGATIVGLVAATALLLTSCSVGDPVDRDAQDGNDPDAKTLRLAHVYDGNHPVAECGVKTVKKSLEGSGVQITSYPAGQLGSEAESLEQVHNGSLDMAIAGPAFLGVWHKPIEVMDAAYVFDDVDQFVETTESEMIKSEFDELYESSDIKVLSNWYYGTRHVTANRKVSKKADFEGLKVRTPDAPLYLKNIEAMGGTATPMALDEVYLGLQQGVIDAQENPIPTIATAKFNEVQKYINLTGHMIQGVQINVGRSAYEGLSEEEISSLDSALKDGAEATRKCVEDQEESILEDWEAGDGIKVNENVDRDAFADAAEKAMLKESWGDLYKQISEAK